MHTCIVFPHAKQQGASNLHSYHSNSLPQGCAEKEMIFGHLTRKM